MTMTGNDRTGDPQPRNPYVGPRPFEREESRFFFGRDEETKILSGLVVAHQLSLFYAQSGAGKSSLLRAGLLPRLTRKTRVGSGTNAYLYQGMRVLPIVTVGRGVPPRTTMSINNMFSFSAQLCLLPTADPDELAALPLADTVEILLDDGIEAGAVWEPGRARNGRVRPPLVKPDVTLLIFDQFEEIFTVHPERWREREDFFRQVEATLTRFPALHMLFTMREDYLAELTPYANLLTDDLRHRFRMERLRAEGALAAVTQPALAARPTRTFAPSVAEELVNNLRRIQRSQRSQRLARVQQTTAENSMESPLDREEYLDQGEYIEPVHLQIVCRDLWAGLPVDRTQIQESDLHSFGDVDQALTNFYERTLTDVVAATAVSERALRHWFTEELITPAHTKGLVYRDEANGETSGLSNAAVDMLRDAWLIRSDIRSGDTWYELAHDRLVEPILASNVDWLQRQNRLFRAAQEWADGERRTEFLYDETRLADALQEAGTEPHDQLVAAFVEASRARIRSQSLQRRIFRLGIAAVLSMIVTVVIFVLWTTTRVALRETAIARDSVQRLRVAAESLLQSESAPQRGLLLAVEATNLLDPATGHTDPQAFQALYRQFTHWQQWQQTLTGHRAQVSGVRFGAENLLFSAAVDGRLLRWDLTTGAAVEMVGQSEALSAFAYHPATDQIALGTESGQLLLLQPAAVPFRTRRTQAYAEGQRLSALAFTPDGETVISAGGNGLIQFWPVSDPAAPVIEFNLSGPERCTALCWVRTLAISGDGRWLAAGGENRRLTLWRLDLGGEPVEILQDDYIGTVWAATFSPDSQWLLAGDGAGNLRRYALAESVQRGDPPQVVPIKLTNLVDMRALAVNPSGSLAAVGDGSGVVGLFSTVELTPTVEVLARLDNAIELEPVNTVAFDASGTQIASGGMDGTVRLWQVAAQREPVELQQHIQRIRAVALYPGPLFTQQSPAVETLISAGEDETVQFWSMTDPPVHVGMLREAGNQILAAALHPEGKWLATGGRDGQLRLYPLAGAIPDTPILVGDVSGEIATVAFDPSGTLLAAGGVDRTILLWKLADLSAPPLTLENDSTVFALAFDGTGTQLAAGDERWVKVWNFAQSPPAVERLYMHNDWVWSVAFSPDGRYLASVSADSMLHLAPLAETAEEQEVFAHEQRARTVAFAPDGTLLATAGDDQLIRLWDPKRLDKPLAEFAGHRGEIRALRFQADGKRLVSAGADGIVRRWTVDLATLQAMACARTGRNLTEAEWALYFPSKPYHVTCPTR